MISNHISKLIFFGLKIFKHLCFFIFNTSYINFQQNFVKKFDKHNYIHYKNIIIKPIHQIEPLKIKHVIFEVTQSSL
jgi:hypothetical protein